jgi:hypothetical protein
VARPPELTPERFFRLPELFLLELGSGKASFVPMTRESYARSIFTDRGRVVAASGQGWDIPLAGLVGEFESRGEAPGPVNYVFHVAHCGSTLLARALDAPGRSLVVREPYALRQLAAQAAAPGGPGDRAGWRRCLTLVAALLSRTWDPAERVVVKANVPVNFILGELMDLAGDNRGILLYAGLDRYLLSVLKTPRHRQWVGNVLRQLAGGIGATPPLTPADLAELSAPRAAACLWLAQHARFAAALAADERLRSLDCEDFFARPAAVLAAAARHFGLALTPPEVEAIAGGELFRRHAKDPGRAYDRAAREAELARLEQRLGGELADARAWARDVLARGGLAPTLCRPLLPAAAEEAPGVQAPGEGAPGEGAPGEGAPGEETSGAS